MNAETSQSEHLIYHFGKINCANLMMYFDSDVHMILPLSVS